MCRRGKRNRKVNKHGARPAANMLLYMISWVLFVVSRSQVISVSITESQMFPEKIRWWIWVAVVSIVWNIQDGFSSPGTFQSVSDVSVIRGACCPQASGFSLNDGTGNSHLEVWRGVSSHVRARRPPAEVSVASRRVSAVYSLSFWHPSLNICLLMLDSLHCFKGHMTLSQFPSSSVSRSDVMKQLCNISVTRRVQSVCLRFVSLMRQKQTRICFFSCKSCFKKLEYFWVICFCFIACKSSEKLHDRKTKLKLSNKN